MDEQLTQTERGLLASYKRSLGAGYNGRWKYRSQRGPYEALADLGYLERKETQQTPYGEYICYVLTEKGKQ